MKLESSLLTINHKKGRNSPFGIDVIVVHVTEGSASSVRSWFNNPQAQVSAHYMVTRAGAIVQFVKETDTAWHAGRTSGPTAGIVIERAGANVNGYSVGIEHEGTGTEELTDTQRAASVSLVKDIAKRYNIPLTRRHIIGHREVFDRKTCPGRIDLNRLVREANDSPVALQYAPRIVWSRKLNDWLVVTRYESDTSWYYMRVSHIKTETHATVPLSQMPANP